MSFNLVILSINYLWICNFPYMINTPIQTFVVAYFVVCCRGNTTIVCIVFYSIVYVSQHSMKTTSSLVYKWSDLSYLGKSRSLWLWEWSKYVASWCFSLLTLGLRWASEWGQGVHEHSDRWSDILLLFYLFHAASQLFIDFRLKKWGYR